jgi:hypothetical protein
MRVCQRVMCAAASGLAALCMTVATCAASDFGQFRTPSGKIGCGYDNNTLRCDVDGGVKPLPPQPKSCEFDWGQGFWLRPKGPAAIVCAGDTARNNASLVVRYGTTWRRGSFACNSSPNGLRCTNADHHGFFISKGEAYRF